MPRPTRTSFTCPLPPAPEGYQPPNSGTKLNRRRTTIAGPPALVDLPVSKPAPKPNRFGAITPDVLPHELD